MILDSLVVRIDLQYSRLELGTSLFQCCYVAESPTSGQTPVIRANEPSPQGDTVSLLDGYFFEDTA